MNFLFPYLARWKAMNWTRYHHIFTCLARMGHKIYVLQPPFSNLKETNFQEIETIVPENIYLSETKLNKYLWNLDFPFNKLIKKGYYALACKNQVRQLIKKYHIDVLFLYNLPHYPLLQLKNESLFVIFDFADDYINMLEHELGKYNHPYVMKLARSLLNKLVEKSDLVLSVSKSLVELIENNGKSAKLLPNGASLYDFELQENNGKSLGKYCKPVIGFLGSFEYFIDFNLILSIAARLPHYTFLLVGSGRDFDKVKNMIIERKINNVMLTGAIPHSEIRNYIKEMDICLNIFTKDDVSQRACPIKLFEYLIMKKPVISSRLKEIEYLDKNFVFFADTTDEFVKTIELILTNKSLSMEYVTRGYDAVINEYNWNKIAERLIDLIPKKNINR